MTGVQLYDSLVARITRLNDNDSIAGQLAIRRARSRTENFLGSAAKVMAATPDGIFYARKGDPGVIFGVRSPYPTHHLLVMPDLAQQPGIETIESHDGSVLYTSKGGSDTFNVKAGFRSDEKYESAALGIAQVALPGLCYSMDHDPDIAVTTNITAVWRRVLGWNAQQQ